jgi:hypothetical protein
MPALGGSPLGLIGVKSRPTGDGMSTFNGGRSRNVNVNLYNSGKEGNKEKLQKKGLNTKGGAFSLFTGDSFIRPWPNIGKGGNDEKLKIGIGDEDQFTGISRRTLHNNDVYDTSIINLVDKTANTGARLRPADFAYLKNLGVFPNNRLMVARRFAGPAPDDIYGFKKPPISVLISWKPPGDENFLEISFGEEWEDAKADFTEVLNNIGKDLTSIDGIGKQMGAANALVPLPGWTEGLTQNILASMGVLSDESTQRRLQVGNPNLIKEAKRRKTVAYGQSGSGLMCKVSVKMVCEYEQKFISGIDPTIAYMDILSNITRFGTSPSVDYGLNKKFRDKILGWVSNPKKLITEFVTGLKKAIDATVDTVRAALNEISSGGEKDKPTAQQIAEKGKEILDKISSAVGDSLAKTVQKYEEEIKGIVNALTLSPSTPWHITLGNPLRPVFSSGDMYTTDVTLSLGPNLAFNDLPSSIKVEFTLSNARNWGLQEIMAKFNTGHLRTVNVVADSASLNPNQSLLQGAYYFPSGTQSNVEGVTTNNVTAASSASAPGSSNTPVGSATTTKENNIQTTVNSDPNSSSPPVQNEPQKTTVIGTGTDTTAKQQVDQQGSSNINPTDDANATSKRGYSYNLSIEGNNKIIRVTDKSSNIILNKTYNISELDSKIIDDAKTAVNDK